MRLTKKYKVDYFINPDNKELTKLDIDYGGMCPISTNKEHLLKTIQNILNRELDLELDYE